MPWKLGWHFLYTNGLVLEESIYVFVSRAGAWAGGVWDG